METRPGPETREPASEPGTGKQQQERAALRKAVANLTSRTRATEKTTRRLVGQAAQGRRAVRKLNSVLPGDIRSMMWHSDTPHDSIRADLISGDGEYKQDTDVTVHPEEHCAGRDQPCCVHNPSPHHMKDWPKLWDGTMKTMSRRCPHGEWHPDFDHLGYTEYGWGLKEATKQAKHDCDGCCQRIFF